MLDQNVNAKPIILYQLSKVWPILYQLSKVWPIRPLWDYTFFFLFTENADEHLGGGGLAVMIFYVIGLWNRSRWICQIYVELRIYIFQMLLDNILG